MAKSSLKQVAHDQLEQSSILTLGFINNWFDYRFMDLGNLAVDDQSINLLASLEQGYIDSGLALKKYTKSYDWLVRTADKQNKFIEFKLNYDYVYDIFLIDKKGNILFTLAHEEDLGSNLYSGPYAKTHFAKMVQDTLQTGKSLFSDIEHYSPSDKIIAGFISAIIVDGQGKKQGVLAIQLKMDRILKVMNPPNSRSSLIHYLAGSDLLLRTSIKQNLTLSKDKDILSKYINNLAIQDWKSKKIQTQKSIFHLGHPGLVTKRNKIFTFTGVNGKKVIATYKALKLPGVNWILLSEIKVSEALRSIIWLERFLILFVMLVIFITILLANYLSKRITRPIIDLSHKAMLVAAGELNTQVEITANNEIGYLAQTFNHMVLMRQVHEQKLEQSIKDAKDTLFELKEQKFALDQHAIVAITDVQGTITYVNQLFCDISGYDKAELIGQNHRLLNSGVHDLQLWKSMYKTIANGSVWHREICNKSKQGNLYWVDTTIVPFLGRNGKPSSYVAIRTDITERKIAEFKLIDANEKAQSAVKAKSDFLATMSHEIRTPMNGVIGMLDLLLDSKLNDEQQYHARLAQSSGQSLLILLNDILDFSKIEAGKLEIETIDFDLLALVDDLLEAIALQAKEKGLKIKVETQQVTQVILKGDPGRIRQILTNLLGNAIKFTSQGEISLLLATTEIANDQLKLSCKIKDTGIGIAEAKLAYLFDSFSQVDSSTTRKYGGTGLGLSIVKLLCELMGGQIKVSSQEGVGSCFEFELIVKKGDRSSVLKSKHDIKKLQRPDRMLKNNDCSAKSKILLVEDNKVNQLVACGILKDLAVQVDIANNGVEALAMLQQATDKPYQLILMDCQMPEMDGYDCSRQIRANKAGKQYQSIAIIAMTANAMLGDKEKCLAAGMSDYLTKPIDKEQLQRVIQHWLLAQDISKQQPLMSQIALEIKSQQNSHASEPAILDKMSDIVWDQKAALKRMRGKEKNLLALVKLFLEDMPARINDLKESILQHDMERSRQIAHTIKGVSANISALQLQQLSALLEAAAKAQQQQILDKKRQDLDIFYNSLIKILQAYSRNKEL